MSYYKIRPRSGTADQWSTANPVLKEREIGFELPDGGVGTGNVKMKMGDGVTTWNELPYAIPIYLSEDDIVQNATTDSEFKVPSASVAKNLQDQIIDMDSDLSSHVHGVNFKIASVDEDYTVDASGVLSVGLKITLPDGYTFCGIDKLNSGAMSSGLIICGWNAVQNATDVTMNVYIKNLSTAVKSATLSVKIRALADKTLVKEE